MSRFWHVTSTRNRESITSHGLDWTRMGLAHGIAGSRTPEKAGVFVCRDPDEVDFFVRINNTGGPVDVWAVDDIADGQVAVSHSGFGYVAFAVPAAAVSLIEADAERVQPAIALDSSGRAYRSRLTIAYDDITQHPLPPPERE